MTGICSNCNYSEAEHDEYNNCPTIAGTKYAEKLMLKDIDLPKEKSLDSRYADLDATNRQLAALAAEHPGLRIDEFVECGKPVQIIFTMDVDQEVEERR
jgi:hypothetical protein